MPAPRIPRTMRQRKSNTHPGRRPQHLAFVRQLPCVVCGKAAPSEAAHVRSGSDAGKGMKPSDRYSLPLCNGCHALQHDFGELGFWSVVRIDPLKWLSGCGQYREMLRPARELSFVRGRRSA
jgi:hypothetical protein